jgi:hypothetical protein
MKNKRTYKVLYGAFFATMMVLTGCDQPTENVVTPPLAAPGNVQVIAAERQLTVTWEAAAGAESYEVYYGSAEDSSEGEVRPDASGENVTRYGSAAAVISALYNRTTYYVWVTALNSAGEAWSEPVSGTPQKAVTPPATPQNIQITGLNNQLMVSWEPAGGAVGYEVYLGTGADFGNAVKKIESSGLSAFITGLENGVEYTVWVKAINSAGTSPLSASLTGTPASAPVFYDIDELTAYFAEQAENTSATPYAVALSGFDIASDLTRNSDPLGKVYAAAGTKYFSLDLSGCSGNLGTATTTAPSGKSRLVSCVLPDGLETIEDYAFYNCTSLASIQLPDSLESIGNNAFYGCTSLVSIDLPEGFESIGTYAFFNCTSFASISLPESLESIAAQAFFRCTSLASITLSEGLTSIGSQAFYNCTSLASITLPEGLTTIGNSAFYGCTSLTSIDLPEGLTSIGGQAFQGCTSLVSVDLPESLEYITTYAFYGCTSLAYIDLPESLKDIEDRAFQGCAFTSISLPAGLTRIRTYAFYGCTSLASITLPESLTTIGNYAFQGCTSLASITLEGPTTLRNSAFYGCTSRASITLPESLTTIEGYAFYGCTSLASITLPESLTTIGGYAFYDCISLESINLPKNLVSIGNYALTGCSSLGSITVAQGGSTAFSTVEGGILLKTEGNVVTLAAYPYATGNVTLPDNITAIGNYAFSRCIGLTAIDMPASISGIGDSAFESCLSLGTVTIRAETPPTVNANSFTGALSGLTFYVPAGKVGAYQVASGWNTYSGKIEEIPGA